MMFVIGVQGIKPIMGHLDETSIAWQAGLREGDKIVAVDGYATPTLSAVYEQLLSAFLNRSQVKLKLADERLITIKLNEVPKDIETSELQKIIGLSIRLSEEDVIISEVAPDSPAAQAGMQAGDQVLAINGQSIRHWRELVRAVIDKPGQTISVEIQRKVQDRLQRETLPIKIASVDYNGETIGRIGVRPKAVTPLPESMYAMHQYGVLEAIPRGIEKTWDLSVLTLKMLGKIVLGEASIKNISGPITIAEVAGQSAQMGFESFLRFLAIVSLSLGVINLLPIPMLDGGHLLYYLIEIVKGSPVSEAAQEFGLKIGVAILIMLMSVALFNDFNRLLQ